MTCPPLTFQQHFSSHNYSISLLSDDEDLEAMEAEILKGEKPPPVIENVEGDQPAPNKSKGQSTATAKTGEATADKIDGEQASSEIGKIDVNENGSERLSKKAKKKKKKGRIE